MVSVTPAPAPGSARAALVPIPGVERPNRRLAGERVTTAKAVRPRQVGDDADGPGPGEERDRQPRCHPEGTTTRSCRCCWPLQPLFRRLRSAPKPA